MFKEYFEAGRIARMEKNITDRLFSCGVFNKRAASYVLFVACREFL